MEWEDQPSQLRVLDWRRRARRYGLTSPASESPLDGDEEPDVAPEQEHESPPAPEPTEVPAALDAVETHEPPAPVAIPA